MHYCPRFFCPSAHAGLVPCTYCDQMVRLVDTEKSTFFVHLRKISQSRRRVCFERSEQTSSGYCGLRGKILWHRSNSYSRGSSSQVQSAAFVTL